MNGLTSKEYVYDSNSVIDHVEKRIHLKDGRQIISVITEMEVLAKPDLSSKEELERKEFLSKLEIVPLTDDVKDIAISIRRFGKPRPKLPDAIVAATAVFLDMPLVSNDDKILRLKYPGLVVESFV